MVLWWDWAHIAPGADYTHPCFDTYPLLHSSQPPCSQGTYIAGTADFMGARVIVTTYKNVTPVFDKSNRSGVTRCGYISSKIKCTTFSMLWDFCMCLSQEQIHLQSYMSLVQAPQLPHSWMYNSCTESDIVRMITVAHLMCWIFPGKYENALEWTRCPKQDYKPYAFTVVTTIWKWKNNSKSSRLALMDQYNPCLTIKH